MGERTEASIRRGARFTCHGDGLCCTDAHMLGPLTLAERTLVEAIEPSASVPDPRMRGRYLATRRGACVFLVDGLCALHARLGEESKPGMCARFPFGRVRTTVGVRAITDHRCPCRTMGERAEVRAADVPSGPASVAPSRIALDARRRVPFRTYARAHEAPLVDALVRGELEVLGAPFPALDGVSWRDVAEHFRAMKDGVP